VGDGLVRAGRISVAVEEPADMARYKDVFQLSVQDIELIERALRHEIGELSDRLHVSPAVAAGGHKEEEADIRRLHEVLGKLHNQKIFFGQANQTGIPISG
jgi:hypothetical protein